MFDTVTWNEVIHDAFSEIFKTDGKENLTSVDWSINADFIAFGSSNGGIQILSTSEWQKVKI